MEIYDMVLNLGQENAPNSIDMLDGRWIR